MKLQIITNKYFPKALTISLYTLVCCYANGQCNIIDTQYIVYKCNNASVQYTEYTIDNCSDDTLYLWIDQETSYNDSLTFSQNNYCFFRKYIRSSKCGTGLSFLCYDGNINYGDSFPPPPVIGSTFLKKLVPQEKFRIISVSDTVNKSDIHFVPRIVVDYFFKMDVLDELCYKESYIII